MKTPKKQKGPPNTPKSTQKSTRRRVIESDDSNDESENEHYPDLFGADDGCETEEEEDEPLGLEDKRPPHVRCAVEYDSSSHKGKLVAGAFIFVTALMDSGKPDLEQGAFAAVVTNTLKQGGRKLDVSYVNDEPAQTTNNFMVFVETDPPYQEAVWLKQIQSIMPTGRVCKHAIEGAEDAEGHQKYEWHIDIRGIPDMEPVVMDEEVD